MKRLAAILILTTLTGLFYVYEEVEAVKIGYEIRRQEQDKASQLDRLRDLNYNIARLKAPEFLERQLLARNIKLESPKSWQKLTFYPGAGAVSKERSIARAWLDPGMFIKFFLGTARAEAKETSR